MLGTRMEQEIREQPYLFRQNWAFYDEQLHRFLKDQSFELILLVARGSSDNAALYARYLIEVFCQIPVTLAAPSVFTYYHSEVKYPRALAIGISQSGEAPDVAEVLLALRKAGHATLAITNTPHSRITEDASASLLLNVGAEHSVAATKTYTASLLALYAVARALGGELHCPSMPDSSWTEETASEAERAVKTLLNAENLFALARGIRFCSAHETALKLMECSLLACKAYSSADFEHGPRALLSAESAAVVFGKQLSPKRFAGAEVIHCPERVGVEEAIMPVWDALFGQWLALSAARARGLDPDHPEGLEKVTKTL
jgi:glucosamine--fructose-6-phosphate aminotransferase (isomerizing)